MNSFIDFYQILSIHPASPLSHIKSAYHRTLLQHHPDKLSTNANHDVIPRPISITTIKQAYITLSNPSLRAEYDETRAQWLANASGTHSASGPRPAQVISLDDFIENIDKDEVEYWSYSCRCGGTYRITEAQMEKGQHLVGCENCSEVIWVGFEQAEDPDGEDDPQP